MDDKKIKRYCPDCRYQMEFIKSEKDVEIDGKSLNMLEIWNCLNCNEEWEFDIEEGNWKLKSLKRD